MANREQRQDEISTLMGELEGRMPSVPNRASMSHGFKNVQEGFHSLGFVREFEDEKRDEALQLVSIVDKQVQGVLAEVQYIAEILATQKKYKEKGIQVENINEKIKKAIKKIQDYMNPKEGQTLGNEAANRRTSGGISVEQNPLIKEMGGMPLENISPEWSDSMVGETLDKTELENQVNKLKDRVTKANELKNKLKLANKPTSKPGQALTPKYQKKLDQAVKYILKEMPEPPMPRPAPAPTIAPPRPY